MSFRKKLSNTTWRTTRIYFKQNSIIMIGILTITVLILLYRLLKIGKKSGKYFSADENNHPEKQANSIVGESRFVLSDERKKDFEPIAPKADSSGKMDIEIPLDYETKAPDLLEEQEELESLGLQNDYSKNITFDEMMAVVNEIGNDETEPSRQTGKLLYENENTDWLEQLASASENNSKRIASLINLHLERLESTETKTETSYGKSVEMFDIVKYT